MQEMIAKMTAKGAIDFAPDLSKDDIEVRIDEKVVEIFEVNKVKESTGKNPMTRGLPIYGYLIQFALPGKGIGPDPIRICVTLTDRETKEKGEGCLFWRKPAYDTSPATSSSSRPVTPVNQLAWAAHRFKGGDTILRSPARRVSATGD